MLQRTMDNIKNKNQGFARLHTTNKKLFGYTFRQIIASSGVTLD
jgi:hypothetical protein